GPAPRGRARRPTASRPRHPAPPEQTRRARARPSPPPRPPAAGPTRSRTRRGSRRVRAPSPLGGGRLVVGGELRAFAEEELLCLVEQDLVGLLRAARQPVLVHDHLEVLQPHLPRILRNALVDALAELVVPGLELQARKFLPELCTIDHPRHPHSPLGPLCITQP